MLLLEMFALAHYRMSLKSLSVSVYDFLLFVLYNRPTMFFFLVPFSRYRQLKVMVENRGLLLYTELLFNATTSNLAVTHALGEYDHERAQHVRYVIPAN